ncbi:MAG: hypothetical protein J6B24_05250 [Clostridia bacterium]|nr:hypothetical protein [Clostridia bacterium]
MNDRYLRIMESSLSAYPDPHIRRYLDEVKQNGLTEHGFPRLTANIGILLSHGIRTDLAPLFREMMDFCCEQIPKVKAANDFSVREIVCCLTELEAAGLFPEDILRWKSNLMTIFPETCYNCYATKPESGVRNWALFTAVSEYFRQDMGLCDSREFIDLQLQVQLKWLDENGLYCDAGGYAHQPIMYDHVSRGLFALLLHKGYRGKHYAAIDAALRKAGLCTLAMQSVTGEMAFGGRSNQFLHNEGWLAAILEYEANRYKREGDLPLAARFKSAALRAVEAAEGWLSRTPIRHVKNRYPTETRYGCEGYGYFDKYMITAASNFYAASLICDDSIPAVPSEDAEPTAFLTSDRFHKLFLKAGGYGLEFDLNADPQYDATGLGRLHRADAPSAICLSMPCAVDPLYTLDIEEEAPTERVPLSLCPAVKRDGEWLFGADPTVTCRVESYAATDTAAETTLTYEFPATDTETAVIVTARYRVASDGVTVTLTGDGELAHALPAFAFDGETAPSFTAEPQALTVFYEGWLCRYTADCPIEDTGKTAANRNGRYAVFTARALGTLTVRVEILKA